MVQRFTFCIWYYRPASLGKFSGEQVDIISVHHIWFVCLELFLPPLFGVLQPGCLLSLFWRLEVHGQGIGR